MSKRFKVGDKVKAKDSTFGYTGETGTIVKKGIHFDWSVLYEGGGKEAYDEEDLELIEEEKTMTKEKKYFKGQPLIRNNGSEVEFLHDDGGDLIPVLISHGDNSDWVDRKDVKPSNKFTFAQVIQGLLEGYFEKGDEFKANGRSIYVDSGWRDDLGLVTDLDGDFVRMEIGSNLINTTWELVTPPVEEPIKELTLDELEEILGHKVKIKNND